MAQNVTVQPAAFRSEADLSPPGLRTGLLLIDNSAEKSYDVKIDLERRANLWQSWMNSKKREKR